MMDYRSSEQAEGGRLSIVTLRRQRDQALACLILALMLSLAAFLTAFDPRQKQGIEGARQMLALHESQFRNSIVLYEQNKKELSDVSAALDNIRRAAPN